MDGVGWVVLADWQRGGGGGGGVTWCEVVVVVTACWVRGYLDDAVDDTRGLGFITLLVISSFT